MKRIMIIIGIIGVTITGMLSRTVSHNNSNKGYGIYDHQRSKDIPVPNNMISEDGPDPDKNVQDYSPISSFDFDSRKNILIVWQDAGYWSQFHVNDISDTDPASDGTSKGLEYRNEHVVDNSIFIFASNGPIYFSWHAQGGSVKWINMKFDGSNDGSINTLSIDGGTVDVPKYDTVNALNTHIPFDQRINDAWGNVCRNLGFSFTSNSIDENETSWLNMKMNDALLDVFYNSSGIPDNKKQHHVKGLVSYCDLYEFN